MPFMFWFATKLRANVSFLLNSVWTQNGVKHYQMESNSNSDQASAN